MRLCESIGGTVRDLFLAFIETDATAWFNSLEMYQLDESQLVTRLTAAQL